MKISRPLAALCLCLLPFALPACSSCGGGAAGSDAAKLMPNYSVGLVTLKSYQELAGDIGVAQLVAVGGVDAQRDLAQMAAVLGFDPTNPATVAAAGLDANAPITLGVTRLAGEMTTPILFVRATDPAAATNYFLQKAPLARITMSPPMTVGSHTVYTGTGEGAIAATAFDKVLAVAIGDARSQPMTALQELMGVEGGQIPSLEKEATYQAAMSPMGAADVVGYVNVPALSQGLATMGLDAEGMRAVGELRRFASMSVAMDVQGGVLSAKYFWTPTPGGMPARIFSEDASDVAVLDRIGGQPLASMRATIDLPTVWAQLAPQFPELAQVRQEMLSETGLNLDTDIIGMLSGTLSVTLFRLGSQPGANDVVLTAGLTDPTKVNRILQVMAAKGMAPTNVPVGGVYVSTWNLDGLNVSMAPLGNQLVVGFGRDAGGLGRIILGQEQPSFRSQIRDPNVAGRFGKGGNGAAFVNLGPLMQHVAAMDPSASAFTPATGMIDTLGMFYEPAGAGYLGQLDMRLVQGQTIANWLVTLARASAAQPSRPTVYDYQSNPTGPAPGTIPPPVVPTP